MRRPACWIQKGSNVRRARPSPPSPPRSWYHRAIGKGRRPTPNRRRVNAMLTIPRRQFLIGSALPTLVGAMKARAAEPVDIVVQDGAVQLRSDGLALSPADYARLLGRL